MAYDIGQGYLQIIPSAEGFSSNLTQAVAPETKKASSSIGKSLSSGIGKGFKTGAVAVSAAATATVGMFVKGSKDVAAYGDNVDKMSQKLGLSASAYQKWDYVMNLAGTDMGSMTTGLKTLTNKLDAAKNGNKDAQDSFKTLGISMKDIKSMSREELFAKSIEGLQGMKDSTERAALANKLFGKSGQNLTPLFNQSSKATKDLMEQAEKYGMVMSDDAVKASADFTDSMTTMQMTATGFRNRMMAEFLPSMTKVTDGMAKVFTGDMSGLDSITEGITGFLDKTVDVLPSVLQLGSTIITGLVQGIVANLPKLVTMGATTVTTLIGSILSMAPTIISSAGELIQFMADGITAALPNLSTNLTQGLTMVITNLGVYLPQFLSFGADIIIQIASGLFEALPSLISSLPTIISTLVSTLVSMAPQLVNVGFKLIKGLASGIITSGPAIVSAIAGLIPKALGALASLPGKMLSAGTKAVKQLANGFKPSMVTSAISKLVSTAINALAKLPGKVWNAIKSVPKKLAEAFKFTVPKIKLPHFSIDGKFSLIPPKAPKFSVKWYREAMDTPYMFSRATLFGAGEAGDEIMYGRANLMNDIDRVVANRIRTTNGLKGTDTVAEQNITLNVYGAEGQSVAELAKEVERRLIESQNRRRLAWR